LFSIALTLAYMVYIGSTLRTGLGVFLDSLIGLGVGVLIIALFTPLFWLLSQALRLVRRRPDRYHAAIMASVLTFIGFLYVFEVPLSVALPIGGGLMVGQILIGGGIGLWRAGSDRKVLMAGMLTGGLALSAAVIGLLLSPGTDRGVLSLELPSEGKLDAPNPASPGSFEVNTLTYGSGTDLRRPEFGADVGLITKPVDVSAFVEMDDFEARVRGSYWGFGSEAFPLNGRVWYPAGEGPFPLVLILHGNDFMTEPADAGYAYMGELLASRGFIAVSVDENFFGSFQTGQLNGEMDGRAVLLLEHIRQWETWNRVEGNLFHGKVDLDNIAVIGHSRGGEAGAVAAAFAELDAHPDDPAIRFDYDFKVKSVVGIAPSDGYFRPQGEFLNLTDINYLLLQGTHDADVHSGIRTYNRARFTGKSPRFKAAVYTYRANHSQFNTVWGRRDGNIPAYWLNNQKPLLQPDEQRQVARVFITAFLEATLHEDPTYLPLFQDSRLGADWLPETHYAAQFQPSDYKALATYQDGENSRSADIPGVEIQAQNLALEEREINNIFGGSQHNQSLAISWNDAAGLYSLTLPDGSVQEKWLDSDATLTFAVADLQPYNPDRGPLDLTVEIVDSNGGTARVALLDYGAVLPALPVQFTKWAPLEAENFGDPTEPIFHTVEIPLAAFDGIDRVHLSEIRFHFDRTSSGQILLDEIGFR
jgi:pimeloyl-ACP methyl ester carboxylesterase